MVSNGLSVGGLKIRPVISQDFSWFQGFHKSFFASECSCKKRSSHQGKKEVACIVSKSLVSCLWGCGESVNPPKIKHPGGSGGLCSLRQRETQACYPFFMMFYYIKSHAYSVGFACLFCYFYLFLYFLFIYFLFIYFLFIYFLFILGILSSDFQRRNLSWRKNHQLGGEKQRIILWKNLPYQVWTDNLILYTCQQTIL